MKLEGTRNVRLSAWDLYCLKFTNSDDRTFIINQENNKAMDNCQARISDQPVVSEELFLGIVYHKFFRVKGHLMHACFSFLNE